MEVHNSTKVIIFGIIKIFCGLSIIVNYSNLVAWVDNFVDSRSRSGSTELLPLQETKCQPEIPPLSAFFLLSMHQKGRKLINLLYFLDNF